MIDIETLSTLPNATILTIAAQGFDPFGTGYYDKHSYYARVTLESQEDRHIDDSTLEWWATQGPALEEAMNEENRIPLDQALLALHKICWNADFLWSQGTHFDFTILEHAYRSRELKQPWQFYKIRDSRSVISLWPDCPVPPTSHHSLEDCRRQIDRLQATLKHLNIKAIK